MFAESKDGELKNGMGTQSLIDLGEFGTKKYYTVDRRVCSNRLLIASNIVNFTGLSTIKG